MAELVDRRSAAKQLSLSVRQLDRIISAGKIRAVRIGSSVRLRQEDIDDFVNGNSTMTKEKMDKAVQACLEALKAADGGLPYSMRGSTSLLLQLPADAPEAERHLVWMCEQIPGFVKEGKEEKAQRWLGFVQGSLWALGLCTIDQMREDNR